MLSSNRMKETRRVGAARRRSLKLSMIGLPSEGDAGLRVLRSAGDLDMTTRSV